jgi:hypothetical protein
MITVSPMNIFSCAADLLWSRMTREYPDLKFALSEGGIGWIPYFLERVDYVYKQHKSWTRQDYGNKLPSEVFRERFVTCFIDDPVGVRERDKVGIDTITWECDYPHSDSTWPNAPEALYERHFHGVPDEDIHKITHRNALRTFRLDPFAHIPKEACTVGALRRQATDVDLSLKSHGGRPPTDEDRPVTAGDITRQLATAFVGPQQNA